MGASTSRWHNRPISNCGRLVSRRSCAGRRMTRGCRTSQPGSRSCIGSPLRHRNCSNGTCMISARRRSRPCTARAARSPGGRYWKCCPRSRRQPSRGDRPASSWRARASPCCGRSIATSVWSAGSTEAVTDIPTACTSRCTPMASIGSPIPEPAPTSRAISSGIARRWRTTRLVSMVNRSRRRMRSAKRSPRTTIGAGCAVATEP